MTSPQFLFKTLKRECFSKNSNNVTEKGPLQKGRVFLVISKSEKSLQKLVRGGLPTLSRLSSSAKMKEEALASPPLSLMRSTKTNSRE